MAMFAHSEQNRIGHLENNFFFKFNLLTIDLISLSNWIIRFRVVINWLEIAVVAALFLLLVLEQHLCSLSVPQICNESFAPAHNGTESMFQYSKEIYNEKCILFECICAQRTSIGNCATFNRIPFLHIQKHRSRPFRNIIAGILRVSPFRQNLNTLHPIYGILPF